MSTRWFAGGLAATWFVATALGVLDVPAFVVVVVLGVLVMLSVEPDARHRHRGVAATRRNLVLAALTTSAFVPVALGSDLLVGRVPVESVPLVLGALASVCVAIPRLAETREVPAPAVLGHRELILGVTGLVAGARAHQTGETVIAMIAFAVVLPVVMVVRRIRAGACSPRCLANGTSGSRRRTSGSSSWSWPPPDFPERSPSGGPTSPVPSRSMTAAFWVGLSVAVVLVAFPLQRTSLMINLLAVLGSVVLLAELVGTVTAPRDPVTIGLPQAARWEAVSAGRSALVNNHWTFAVQRDAIDFVEVVDDRTHRGDGSRLEDFAIYSQSVLAVADARVTEAVDGLPDLPVGGYTRHDMAGNHLILDIGGGHYVLYGHLEQGSVRVRVGEQVRRGQVIGQVGDSGNSGEPHLHLQVQNKPTFDVEDRRSAHSRSSSSTPPSPTCGAATRWHRRPVQHGDR